MAMNLDASRLLNPMLLWTDVGLRALEMTVNSTQNVSEGVDRIARASASVQASEAAAPDASVAQWAASTVPSATALATDLQRSALDMVLRGWVQFMGTLGSLASMGADMAGKGFARGNAPLQAMRSSLMLPASFGAAATQGGQSGNRTRRQGETRRESEVEHGAMEHALAATEPKRRRSTAGSRPKAKAKVRRSRGT